MEASVESLEDWQIKAFGEILPIMQPARLTMFLGRVPTDEEIVQAKTRYSELQEKEPNG